MLIDTAILTAAMREYGKQQATALQAASAGMTGTELYAAKVSIPDFYAAVEKKNMLERAAGFVCRSSAGRVVRLLQPYDSTIYTQEPEELPAQWGFAWSNEPQDALPFVAISTSPYMVGNCCTEGEGVYASLIDNNVAVPSAYPQGWEYKGTMRNGVFTPY